MRRLLKNGTVINVFTGELEKSNVLMEDGRIIGEGTQEKLLASCEAYREIYETQYGKRAGGEVMA